MYATLTNKTKTGIKTFNIFIKQSLGRKESNIKAELYLQTVLVNV